jgi:hypothetical protein
MPVGMYSTWQSGPLCVRPCVGCARGTAKPLSASHP